MAKSKMKIGFMKQKTLRHAKLSKQGKSKVVQDKKKWGPKKSLRKKGNNHVPKPKFSQAGEENDYGGDMLQMINKEDLDYLQQAINHESYSVLRELRNEGKLRKKRKRNEEEDSNIEQQYENILGTYQVKPKKTKHLLPIKTNQGFLQQEENNLFTKENKLTNQEDIDSDEEPLKKTKITEPEEDVDSDTELLNEAGQEFKVDLDRPVSTAQLLAVREEMLKNRKLCIGVLASGLLEDPQFKAKNFRTLLDMMNEKRPELKVTVCKLVTVSLLEVFKDVIPSYQIKHQENSDVKLKKETQKLQGYERILLSSYKSYLQKLEKLVLLLNIKRRSHKPSEGEVRLAELAFQCLCELLITHPNFNFAQNIVQMVIPNLNHNMLSMRQICANCITTLFKNDKKGEISLDIMRRINHLVKTRNHHVHSEVLTVLLALPIKDINLEKEKEEEIKQKMLIQRKKRLVSMSRNERKRNKQLEALESELRETRGEENKQRKHKYLTEITKIVFTIYFRVLKKAPSSKILSVTLEGLARFSHCINLEFFEDLVNVLNQLLEEEPLGYREQLHCVQTVFTILSGQGEALNIDPLRFYMHLYRNLFCIHAGSTHADTVTVLHALEKSVIHRRKKISQQRIYAFTKRLATLAMQLLHNGSLGCLGFIKTILQLNRAVDILLDTDTSIGEGIYYPELEDPEYCNASNTAMWELTAFERHYHPIVRKYARNIALGVPSTGEGSITPEFGKLKPDELFSQFDPSEMVFKPAVPSPKEVAPKSKPRMYVHLKNDDLTNYIKLIADRPVKGPLNFFQNLSDSVITTE